MNGRAIFISKQLNLASLRFRMLLKEVGLLIVVDVLKRLGGCCLMSRLSKTRFIDVIGCYFYTTNRLPLNV